MQHLNPFYFLSSLRVGYSVKKKLQGLDIYKVFHDRTLKLIRVVSIVLYLWHDVASWVYSW